MDDMAQVKERTKVIFQESEVLLQLINTLLDHAKIEAGKMELVHASVDIRKVVRSVQVSLQGRADKGGIDFQVIVDKAVPGSFLGDAFRLRQIILNLANNAIKFTERGSVRVMVDCMEAEGQKARIRFAVEDTGIGIGEKEQKMVFNAFTQVDGSMGRRYQGTGLGITISRKLVNMMGGDLFLESALGKGSKFWFDLDVEILEHKAKEVPESEETCMGEKDFSNKRILVADDYEPNRQLILLYLEGLKVNVDVVCDGQEAINICDRNYYDVILMDLQMPKVDGYTATKIIRKKSVFCQRSKIIVMTANAGMEARCQCKDLGVDDIVVKPIRRKTFLERVVRFLVSESVSAFPGHDPSDMKAPSVPYGHMDFMRLVNEFAGNKEVAYSLLRNFVMIAEEQILLIQEAVKANDMQVFQEEIHKMKGASGALMLDRLAEKTTRINALLSDKNYAEGLSLLKGLVEEYQFIKTFVMCYRSHA